MLKVVRDKIGFESVDFKDVVVILVVNPDNDKGCVVSFDSFRERKVDGCKYINFVSLDVPRLSVSSDLASVVVLEEVGGDIGIGDIVWVIIILCPKLSLVLIL